MQEKRGEKMHIFEGNDGKLYFNFAQGLKVQMHGDDCDKNANYTFEIVGCHYIGITEYYDVEINGVLLPQPNSANRVKYLISRYGIKTLDSGKRLDLPLTLAEVKAYFAHMEQRREQARSEAGKLTEYISLQAAAVALNRSIGYAQAFGKTDEANALEEQRAELERRAAAELRAHGINPNEIEEPTPCSKCGGRGFVYNHICACAIPLTQTIKDFNVKQRLNLAKVLRW